jgi:hypothetical protein
LGHEDRRYSRRAEVDFIRAAEYLFAVDEDRTGRTKPPA